MLNLFTQQLCLFEAEASSTYRGLQLCALVSWWLVASSKLKLLTVVVTDFYSDALLTVAYVDELCLRLTFCTRVAHYYSCAKNSI